MISKNRIKNFIFKNWEWLVLVIVLIFVFCVRLHFLSVPLERDEGEYAYMGQLILKGIPPYESAYNMKFPGTYYMYASIMFLFGQTNEGIHLGLILINILSSILIFFIFSRMFNRFVGLMSASLFSLMSLSFVFLGFAAHATHFVLLFSLLGIFVLTTKEIRWYTYFISGLCFSLAVLMKQHGIFFIPLGFFLAFCSIKKESIRYYFQIIKSFLYFAIGLILPITVVGISLLVSGTFSRFWFWTIVYGSTYATQGSLSDAFLLFNRMVRYIGITSGMYVILATMFLGVLVVFFSKKILISKEKKIFSLLFFLLSFLTIIPGFYFRPHYFITLIPATALFSSLFFYWFFIYSKNKVLTFIFILVTLLPFFINNYDYLFKYSPNEIIRHSYGSMPFIETKKISTFIRENTKPENEIFVFGSEPEVYFYSDRESATGYIYMYALMEDQPNSLFMQKEMISQVEQVKPKFFLFSGERTSWLMNKNSNTFIFSWAEDFLRNYKVVKIIDINRQGEDFELEGENLKNINPLEHFLTLYERNNEK